MGDFLYESPIELFYKNVAAQMEQRTENVVISAVQNVGVNVDKDELIKALEYDRNQYQKGYDDGKNAVVRCKDCKHSYEDVSGRVCVKGAWLDCVVTDDFFCAYGEEGDDNG